MSNHIRVGKDSADLLLREMENLAKKGPHANYVFDRVKKMFDHHAKIDENLELIQHDRMWSMLNDDGKKDIKRKSFDNAFKDRVKIQRELESLAANQINFIPKPKKNDDPIREMQDAELRSVVRAMPEDKRNRLDGWDDATLGALARAPAAASGLMPAVYEQIRSRVADAENPGSMAAYQATQQAFEFANDALKIIDKDFRHAADFGSEYEHSKYITDVIAPMVK